jgi:hypothetical protein
MEKDLSTELGSQRDHVKRTIEEASKVIVIWGDAGASSQWVNYEIGLADALEKPIIAVLPKQGGVALPGNLQNVQVVKVASDF